MHKRGMGHVEVILAFVLFIGFLIFGIYFFNPLSNDRVLDSSLAYALDELEDNVTTSALTYGIVINEPASSFDAVSLLLSRDALPGSGFYVETPDKRALRGSYDGERVSLIREGAMFFYVRFGEFNALTSVIPSPRELSSDVDYTVSSSERREVLSELHLLALNETYYSDYEQVRTHFNLPRRVDFDMSVVISPTESIVMTRAVPEGFDVVSQVERKELIRTDGSVQFVDVMVRVW